MYGTSTCLLCKTSLNTFLCHTNDESKTFYCTYLSLEDIEPLSVVVPHPDTTNVAPSGMDIAEDGKVTGAVSESKLSK